jgi:Ser/Thr protein kinase RdoA (MazF antagonist)
MLKSAKQALEYYGLGDAGIQPYGTGLINETYLVDASDGAQFILQGLNPVFQPEVNLDIDRVTRHLADKGLVTQRIVQTTAGELWVKVGEHNWRLATFVPGICFDSLHTEEQAYAAGELLGRFHRGVRDLEIELHTQRLGVHDTERHFARLRRSIEECTDHKYYEQACELAEQVFAEAKLLPALPELPDRLVHGDPKISNLVFSEQDGSGVAMIDLDTITHMPLPLEMGDAFRSWCNPRGEDQTHSEFKLELFRGAIFGYAKVTKEFVTEAEWRAFVSGARIIMVELASRFTSDSLYESYFGWNPDIFKDRSTHNQVRAYGQLELEKSLAAQVDEAERIVEKAFGD